MSASANNRVMTDFQKNFISNLKFYRKKAGLSQAALAELCNVSNGTIGNIECGATKPSFDLFYNISVVLKISPKCLIDMDNDRNSADSSYSSTEQN